jgi:RNA-directed DNA polymerase
LHGVSPICAFGAGPLDARPAGWGKGCHLFSDRMAFISQTRWIALSLARASLKVHEEGQAITASVLHERMADVLEGVVPWLGKLAHSLALLSEPTWRSHTPQSLSEWIERHEVFSARDKDEKYWRVRRVELPGATSRQRPFGLHTCAAPELAMQADLARLLELSMEDLSWLAISRPNVVQHYRCRLLPKRTGGLRLIEVPKAGLKMVQRNILDKLLVHVPMHEAAMGFKKGCNVVQHASLHRGQAIVLRFDLQNFFHSITMARVQGLWRLLGYPEVVAKMLAQLCVARTPEHVVARLTEANQLNFLQTKQLALPHLPQGAPTSPALANWAAFHLDLRLQGLAQALDARYSRYADDLVFSGGLALQAHHDRITAWVDAIAQAEGFKLNACKTRCASQATRQFVTGVVVNAKTNVPRAEFDRMKAGLHRLAGRGVSDQTLEEASRLRDQWRGRIAWVAQLNPQKAARLWRLFEQIDWQCSKVTPSSGALFS